MSDLEFVQRCVKGDKPAWDEFVDRYSRLIYNYLHSVLKIKGIVTTRENIADLFQEMFVLLRQDNFRKLKTFKGRNGCSLASWLRQVVVNFAIDYTRRIKPLISIDEENNDGLSLKDMLTDSNPSASDNLLSEEKLSQLTDCIEGLEDDDKYFLQLHMNQGLTLEELKDAFKISRGAVDMRKSRIIGRLRDCFRSKGFALDL